MRRLMVTLEYDGTSFRGWQVQAEGRTVQGAVEEAVERTAGERTRVTGASRTDSGVHAEGQVAHFDTGSRLTAEDFLRALNYWLPSDVSVLHCREVSPAFDARYSASSKLYRYRLLLCPARRPLRDRFVTRIHEPLDLEAMRRCAASLVGEQDFASFATDYTEGESSVRRVLRSEFVEEGDELLYFVEANGFLYNMVRAIVGTLLMVGRGKLTSQEFAAVLAARDRGAAGPTAPARGLALVRVNYPDDPRDQSVSPSPADRGGRGE
jgi:tRNA pseudouridine38-40 synthase